jgi:hypothetical protein
VYSEPKWVVLMVEYSALMKVALKAPHSAATMADYSVSLKVVN